MGYFGTSKGLLVSSVTGSEGVGREIRAGDIITRIGENEVSDVASLLNGLGSAGQRIDLTIVRNRVELRLTVNP